MSSKRESELKFTCEAYHATSIRRGIESVCTVDQSFQKNIISSIYFDTDEWAFAMEKAASDFLKTKVRLRWYRTHIDQGKSLSSKCFLEFKYKIGSKREKTRIEMPFTGDDVLVSLQETHVQELIQSCIAENAPELSAYAIKPKIVVRYTRNRYFEPFSDTRISFDTDIHAFNVDAATSSFLGEVSLDESVLEVKGDCDDLPIALRNLHNGKLKKAAFSKYYECYRLLLDYHQ